MIHDVSLTESFVIGADGQVTGLSIRRSIQILGDEVDRYLWLTDLILAPSIRLVLRVSELDNCRAGDNHFVETEAAKAFELLFDRTLRSGETYSFGYHVDYRAAYRPESRSSAAANRSHDRDSEPTGRCSPCRSSSPGLGCRSTFGASNNEQSTARSMRWSSSR